MLRRLLQVLAITGIWLPITATAAPLEEVFFHSGVVTDSLVQSWSSLEGSRDYVLELGDPNAMELHSLLELHGAKTLTLESERFPGEDAAGAYQALAAHGAEFVSLGAGLPTDDEVTRLNRIGFKKMTFVLTGIPGDEECARIARIKGEVAVTFVMRAYPKYEDKDPLARIPASVPLLFITDYWPWFAHMDVFNMLPHRIRLRVSDMFPDEAGLQYLHNIKRLDRIQVQTGNDAMATEWVKFRGKPLTWISTNWVPSDEGLRAFAPTAESALSRTLTVDRDWELTAEERHLLEKAPVPVRWIHAAPMDMSLSSERTYGRAITPFL